MSMLNRTVGWSGASEAPMLCWSAIPVKAGTDSKAVMICVEGLKPSNRFRPDIWTLVIVPELGSVFEAYSTRSPVTVVLSAARNASDGKGSMQCNGLRLSQPFACATATRGSESGTSMGVKSFGSEPYSSS